MVKLGVNVSEKKAAGSEEGFDTIPLMTPLDAAQLQIPPPDMVRRHRATDTHFYYLSVQIFAFSLTACVCVCVQMALLVVCALAFLVCVVFLVVFKVYQYEQPCPDGFTYTQGRCVPAGVYSYYPPQGPAGRGRLFTIINHYNVAKHTITRAVSPWLSITAEERRVSQLHTKTQQNLD
uniref:Neuronal vesicle trafficking-associated protein 1 n=1 Tax=Astyanax mexicanus TaxID=7994 RepID=A0A8B9HKZ1_ASTMX